MFIDYAAASRKGRLAERNEDCYEILARARVFIVADGMGAAPNGARASQLAAEAVGDFYRAISAGEMEADTPPSAGSRMRRAFQRANERVWSENAVGDALQRMGTTLVVAQFLSDTVVIGAAGDSRCYRFRDGQLSQITRDHILLEENRPLLSPQEVEDLRPLQSVLSRSVGRAPDIAPDVYSLRLAPDESYLLCSNGLTDALPPSTMAKILDQQQGLQQACDHLVERASETAGTDDVTAVLIGLGRGRR